MSNRLSRVERTEQNRSLVLAAARRVFLARGYHGATLEQIADEAGFSKGVVYSQFDSKADLFLTLLRARISERAAENARVASDLPSGGVAALLEHLAGVDRSEPQWMLLLIEFRVHAARDPEINRRYAEAHERTISGLASVLAGLQEQGEELPLPPRQLAEFMLTVGFGAALEQAANPDALGGPRLGQRIAGLITSHAPASSSPAEPRSLA
jgi:AcrR family transcriptional regulator